MRFAAALLAGTLAATGEEIWIGNASGSWSDNSNWADLSAPAAGGDAALVLRFANSTSVPVTATDNLPGTFRLNQLLLENNTRLTFASGPSFTIDAASGATLQFAGAAPVISNLGPGSITLTAGIVLNPASGNLTITGSGLGNLTISSAITQTGGARALVIAATPASPNISTIALSGSNSFTGGVTLQSGNLALLSNTALGTGALQVNGGTLQIGSFATVANAVALNSDLLITASSSGTLSGSISSTAAGTGVTLRSADSTLSLTGASTYTGATTIDFGLLAQTATTGGGTLFLTGNGTAVNSAAFNIKAGSVLKIAAATTSNGTVNRLGDDKPVNLRGASLSYSAATFNTVAQVETAGALTGAGYSTVTIDNSSGGASLRFVAASLTRAEGGTFLFKGSSLGGAFGNAVGNLLFTSAPAGLAGGGAASGTAISILPFAIGDANTFGSGSTFVTYTAGTGIRPLDTATEYVATLAAAGATSNVRLTAANVLAGSPTINSLVLATGGSVSGGGALTISSGALLNNNSGGTIGCALAFGNVEANIFAVANLNISGVVSGSNGLTKSGAGKLTLGGANSFTGTLTVNAGLVSFATAGALGTETSPIIFGGSGAGLSYSGSAALSLTRTLETRTGIAQLDAAGVGNFEVGAISGAGGVRFTSAFTRTFSLSGGSTFTGPVILAGGNLLIGGDSALGSGGALDFSGGKITLNGSWVTGREISLSSLATVDTAGNSARWDGFLSGAGAFVKSGAGTLEITAPATASGTVTVNGGTLLLSGRGALGTSLYTVNRGSQLMLDKSADPAGAKLWKGATLNLNGGDFTLAGNSGAAVSESCNTVTFGGGGNTLSLTAPGNAGTTFRTETLSVTGSGDLLVRGDNLGGPAGAAFSRVVLTNVPASLGGLLPSIYASPTLAAGAQSFAVYDTAADAAGPVGLRALRPAEYAASNVIQNPLNGGSVPTAANFLAGAGATAAGANNTLNSLTLASDGGVTLSGGQTLGVTAGAVLVRSGAGTAAIDGGTLAFGAATGVFATFGDLAVSSEIRGSGGIRKIGSAILTLLGPAAYSGPTTVNDGVLRVGSGGLLAAQTVQLAATYAVFDLHSVPATVGGLGGVGEVRLGGSTLTLGTAGTDMTFGGFFTGAGSIVLVDGGNPAAIRAFSSNAGFGGSVTLNSGRLSIAGANALGGASVIVNGGSLYQTTSASSALLFVLNADLLVQGSGGFDLGAGGGITGAHDLIVQGRGGLTIQAAAAHSGETRTAFGTAEPPSASTGSITLRGAAGALTGTSAIRIGPDSALVIDDFTAFAGGGGRVPANVPLFLSGSSLNVTGNATATTALTLGALHVGGFCTVTISPGFSAAALVAAGSLAREQRGTFLVRTPGLGSAPGAGLGRMMFSSSLAPELVGGGGSGPNTSILPYAIGDSTTSGLGSGFVTDGANGLRLLDPATEYTATLSAAAATHNVRLTTSVALSAPKTINALVLAGGTVSGAGPLTITSGSLLKTSGGLTTLSPNLNFGTAEANFFLPGSSVSIGQFPSSALTVSGVIAGSGGLTKSGLSDLVLTNANTFTGPLTINGGNIRLTSVANLGADSSPVRISANVVSAGLLYDGSTTLSFTRGIEVIDGYGALRTTGAGNLDVPATISGNGGVGITGSGGGFVRLLGTNSYQGPTVVQGSLAIASDAALGGGGPLELKSTSYGLRLDGAWTTGRRIVVSASSSILANGQAALINGPIEGSAALAISNSASTVLTANSPFTGALSVVGNLRFSGAGAVRAQSVAVTAGEFVMDNTATANSDRLTDTGSVQLSGGGSLIFLGNSSGSVRESIGALSATTQALQPVITLAAPGAFPVILEAASFSGGQLYPTVVSGNGLGASTGGFTRLIFRTAPALIGRLIPLVFVRDSGTGAADSFALYDTGSDVSGLIGVRALTPADYSFGNVIANPSNGGSTATDANLFLTGPAALSGAANAVNSLTLQATGGLTLGANQTLTATFPGVLVQSGANALIEGGKLALPSSTAVIANGDLTLRSELGNISLQKWGAGLLTLRAGGLTGSLNAAQGAVRFESEATPAKMASLTVDAGATLDLNGVNFTTLSGSIGGTLALGAGIWTTTGLTAPGMIAGAGGLALVNNTSSGYSAAISGPASYTGPTKLLRDATAAGKYASVLTLNGNGTLFQTSGFALSGGAILQLDNDSTGAPGFSRISNTVPISLNGSKMILGGSRAGPVLENAGILTGTGFSTIQMVSNGQQFTKLTFSQLARNERGTFGFTGISGTAQGPEVNDLVFASGLAAFLVGAGSGATNQPILPFAVENLEGYTGYPRPTLLTYHATNGLRPLDVTTEYATSLIASQNVRLTTPTSSNVPVTVNSLVVDGGSISGSGKITVASGLVLNGTGVTTIAAPVDFGTVEGNLICADGELRLTGIVSGSNGITVTGTAFGGGNNSSIDVVTLTRSNTFTGPITINSGMLRIESTAGLGPGTGEIVINDGTLEYAPPTGLPGNTLTRPVRLNGYQGSISSNTDQFVMAGVISGPASLRISGPVRLTGTNTYTGFTDIASTVSFASDSALGLGALIRLGGQITLLGPWNTNRSLISRGVGDADYMSIDTNGFDAAIHGKLSSAAASAGDLQKRGVGTLRIDDASDFTGLASVIAGTLILDGGLGSGGFAISVSAGATLAGNADIQRAVTISGSLAPGDGVGPMSTRNLALQAGSTLAIELASPTAYDRVNVTGTVTLTGTVNLTLSLLYNPADNADSFVLLSNDGTEPLTLGTARFAYAGVPLNEGQRFTAATQEFALSYAGGDGNDVVLYATPEPSAGLLLLTGLPLAMRRRRPGKRG